MTPDQIALVQGSFAQVEPSAAAALFYERLFALDPTLRQLFTADMATQGHAGRNDAGGSAERELP